VQDNPEAKRFEAHLEGQLAVAEYHLGNDIITFTHTEVPEALEGKGVGGELVKAALEAARERELKVVPLCPFVANYIRRHKKYRDLVLPRFLYMVS
jgi:predicted GNAT family acetyltransferase